MIRTLLFTALFAIGMSGQQSTLTAYVAPGPWAICRATGNPVFCGFDHGSGTETYILYMKSTSTVTTAYAWKATGTLPDGTVVTLPKDGNPTTRVDGVPGTQPTVVTLSFGGIAHDIQLDVSELAPVTAISHHTFPRYHD